MLTSKHLSQANELLKQAKQAPFTDQVRIEKTIELASHLLYEALHNQTGREKILQGELARMMDDPKGKAFTIAMTDQCFRSHRSFRVADQLIFLLKQYGIPSYLAAQKKLELLLFKIFGKFLHFLFVPLAIHALRRATSSVILPGERSALSNHMHHRRKEGVRLNLNHLGEAILSEKEALKRLDVYLHDLTQSDIEYVSIKISTIYSQIQILDWDHTIEILAERLRKLYRTAKSHLFTKKDGTQVPKFVNLDMEEYRDLHLTKELFKKVLDESEFHDYAAGIVLQAYLPDSFEIQKELTQWAMQRKERGGAPIKIRIVKGANLAMEQFESSLREWPQAPYKSKHEVDANYKRMVVYGCSSQHASAAHIGIASHNLFDLSYGLILRAENHVEKEVSIEMLEGMADHIRRAVQKLTGEILLYCPVATKEDFQSAIAYLIRRLDENTGPENFLRHSFGLKPQTKSWDYQALLFKKACEQMHSVSSAPRRKQDRNLAPKHLQIEAPFENEADTDFSLPQNHRWAHQVIQDWKQRTFSPIPLVIGGRDIYQQQAQGIGTDPSNPLAGPLYHYALASWQEVNEALNVAKAHEPYWGKIAVDQRCKIFSKVAEQMREKRSELIGVMMRDGGKTFVEAEPEVSEAIDFAEYYLRSLYEIDTHKDISWKSKGTVLVAPPWNFPISIPAGGIIAALITGNCVLFKPAPEAVLSGWILVNLFWQAGIPKEVLQFINCADEPVGSQLISDPRLNTVLLTGGTSTARLFMKMRPNLDLSAETGGKNALIITGLSDRDLAIKDLVHSAFGHSGQKCSAASLAILEKEVYDDPHFKKQLKAAVESLHVGTPWQLSSKIVPLIRPATDALLRGLTTLDKGEQWLVQPKQDPNNPQLWSPGVKWGVREGSFMHQTELFGPVLAVMRADNLDHALRLANGTAYGLTSGIHSLDEREQKKWMDRIEAGNLYINRGITGAIVQRQPFGGCKASSFGKGAKAGGPNYLTQLMLPTQVALPESNESVSSTLFTFTKTLESIPLSPEDLQLWVASISSYTHWAKKYAKDYDPSKIVGEDNYLRYRPHKRLILRLQSQDKAIDFLRVFAAAHCVRLHLEVSYAKRPIDQWPQNTLGITFTKESDETFLARIKKTSLERVRFLSTPIESFVKAAAEKGCFLDYAPVLANGRFELLHYLREIAVSVDYHRYGNLGLRESELRRPVL